MTDIRSLLARSRTIKTVYETTRRKVSEGYRRTQQVTGPDGRETFVTPDEADLDFGFGDSGLFEGGFDLVPHPGADNPVLTRADIDDCWARFVADPFVVYDGTTYHMFFEIKTMGGHVCLGHAYSEDGLDFTYNRIVIQPESAQHTYPYVFKRDGTWTLIPSPGSNVKGQFRIYESVDFPTKWELRSVPIEEGVRLDPTPIFHDGRWYLIYQEVDSYDVVLASAEDLTGPWERHPESPLFRGDLDRIEASSIGSAEMVPSGRPLYGDDGIHVFYRSHADTAVYHYRITELNETTVEQEVLSDESVFAGRQTERWNRRFMHTVNPVYPWADTDSIVAVDGLEADRYRWSIGIYTRQDNTPT